MALIEPYALSDRWFATINTSMNASVTSMVLASSGATGLAAPTIIHAESEKMKVSLIAVDTPSAGLDTLTVERGYGGTTPATHASGIVVAHYFYEDFFNEIGAQFKRIGYWLVARTGLTDGVIRNGVTALQVKAEGTPSMTVDILAGAAVVWANPLRWCLPRR